MARPTKTGLDYFNLDCVPDPKLELFILENGMSGYGILITLWQMIYYNEGYYIHYNDDLNLMVKKRTLEPKETIVNVIKNALKRGLFDAKMLETYGILTSKALQKRYFPAAQRKKSITVISEYLLIDTSEFKNVVIAHMNPVNAVINPVNVCGNDTNVNVDVNAKANVKEDINSVNANKNAVNVCNNENDMTPNKKSTDVEVPSDGLKNKTVEPDLQPPQPPKPKKEPSIEGQAFAEWFMTIKPESLNPTARNKLNWARTYDELIRLDGRTDQEILRVCQWARGHPIWHEHFLSPCKLRTRDKQGVLYYEKFLEGMKSQNAKSQSHERSHSTTIRAKIRANVADELVRSLPPEVAKHL